jgi:beta-aspartyl-peptidase (threonine type)
MLGGTLSIDWKLPLLITAVLAAGLAAFLAFTYVTLSRRSEAVVRDRFASAARQVCDRIAWLKSDVQTASDAAIADVGAIGGDGGLIAMDGAGRIAFAMNSSGMYRGWVSSGLPAGTAIYSSEKSPAH